MPHFEPAERFRIRILDIDLFNARIGRAVAHPFDHSADGILVTAEVRLDGAIWAIPNPAADSELACLALSPDAKENSLHAAGHANAARDVSHRPR